MNKQKLIEGIVVSVGVGTIMGLINHSWGAAVFAGLMAAIVEYVIFKNGKKG